LIFQARQESMDYFLRQQSTIRYQAAQEKNSWALGLWFDMDEKQDSAFPLYIFSLIHLAPNMLGPKSLRCQVYGSKMVLRCLRLQAGLSHCLGS